MAEGIVPIGPGQNLPTLTRVRREGGSSPPQPQPRRAIPDAALAGLGDAHGRDAHQMDQILLAPLVGEGLEEVNEGQQFPGPLGDPEGQFTQAVEGGGPHDRGPAQLIFLIRQHSLRPEPLS
ncbi:hypothetical protein GALL_508440 [mine drainage metagenome]|uniref:Uncharacterized protein n=1 Tax=mine drainage metagenome TaxID=410659 RepID=A0A1J5P8P5_9ZZZZ